MAVLIVLVAGALIGLVNGLIVTKVRVNSVIATLGVGTILTGLAFAWPVVKEIDAFRIVKAASQIAHPDCARSFRWRSREKHMFAAGIA